LALKFQQAGFANTFALLGGFDAWVEGGYPVEPVVLAGSDPSLTV
jgi:rhodanese-related sulfurtransferase